MIRFSEASRLQDDIVFDEVVIRFTRQIYYAGRSVFQAEIRQSPVPLQGGAFRIDTEDALEEFRKTFAARVAVGHFFYAASSPASSSTIGPAARDLTRLGDELYELLPPSFQAGFPRLVQYVLERGRGIRLVFEASAGDRADRLLNLPWEIFFFQETQAYLARSPRLLIVRRLLDAVRRSRLQMRSPFNVAHVIAHHPAAPRRYRIDERLVAMERETIPGAIAPGRYALVENPGSVEHMQETLRENACQIVHFLGHGETGAVAAGSAPRDYTRRGYLRFVSAAGEPQWVTGEQFQHLLNFTPAVQLIVLNACHGGSTTVGNVALELVHSGLPYVVAMQETITQAAARSFIQAFYTALQKGRSIEYAVAAGRSAIVADMPGTIDWCLPALYTNVGLSAPPPIAGWADRLWQWVNQPGAMRQTGVAGLLLGGLHLAAGVLLTISDAAPSLPDPHFLAWAIGWLIVGPPLLSLVAYRWGSLDVPAKWSFVERTALMLRLLGAASMGLGVSMLCTWLGLMLLVTFGFWALLSPAARFLLLSPAFFWSILFGYSQTRGHGRVFISDARVEPPAWAWDELGVVVAGYILLLAPLAILSFLPDVLAPPLGNVLLGSVLVIAGYILYQQAPDSEPISKR